jgi:DNA-binding transcriptional LysR family regulator
MLDVRRLRLLRELAARGTVTAVADALSYTPSAVSQQLAQLERDAGLPLLERVGRGVRLTEAGRRLVVHADAVLERLDAAEADLARAAGEVGGAVRVSAFQTAAHALVLPALADLAERHPGVRCEVGDAEAEEALPAVRIGDLDVAIAEEYDHAPRPRDPVLEREELCRDPLLVALPAAHPLAGREEVDLAELAGASWATSRGGTAFADMLQRSCRSVGGFEPDIRHRANDLHLLIEIVARTGAVALLPGMGRFGATPGVVLLPPAGGPMERRIFTAVRRGTAERPALRALLDALVAQAERLGLRGSASGG